MFSYPTVFASKSLLQMSLKDIVKLGLQPNYWQTYFKLRKIAKSPRYTPRSIKLSRTPIKIVDSASYVFMYGEIFEQQIYKFKAEKPTPMIIDGGANIGLSILYFKELYPDSKIVAFEPDSKVFSILSENIKNAKLPGVTLVNKALWSSETVLEFMSEGADGGRMVQMEAEIPRSKVQTVRLRDYLNQSVDFLKLDIEGAETEVLRDCQEMLHNVQNLFVEYHSFMNESQTLHEIVNILQTAGFRLHIHPAITSPQPFYQRNINFGMDVQLNIFAFRE